MIQVQATPESIAIGNVIQCEYPSSKTGRPTPRTGEVVEIRDEWFKIETPDGGYRTFRFERVVGNAIRLVEVS